MDRLSIGQVINGGVQSGHKIYKIENPEFAVVQGVLIYLWCCHILGEEFRYKRMKDLLIQPKLPQ